MTPINKLTETEARRLLTPPGKKLMDSRTFKKWAKKLGFTEYPGLGGKMERICYNEADLIKKWNASKEELQAPKKTRGKISI